jgi:hypothetical protein
MLAFLLKNVLSDTNKLPPILAFWAMFALATKNAVIPKNNLVGLSFKI